MFVRAVKGQYGTLGIGKQIDRRGSVCRIEYFDSPSSDRLIHEIDARVIEHERIYEQTRVYHFNSNAQTWEIGRLLDDHGDRQFVRFPNGSEKYVKVDELFVRWNPPILDPTPFLANQISESPRFSDGRSAFVRSQIRQRIASKGISALLSSAIELEAHQIDVVRRVLEDPVQRYLLADEVGLGKTIEAGVLIRQCVLDDEKGCTVLVIVPTALVSQWRDELSSKFFLGSNLDRSVHVITLDDHDRIRAILPKTTMLVIDEAHHLVERKAGIRYGIYDDIAAAAPAIGRIVLLSATPVLHNESEFLEMLHLLDAANYPLGAEQPFRRKIKARQSLAEIVAGLVPQNALFFDDTIAKLVAMFPDDEILQEHTENLRIVVETMPAEDDPALVEAIGNINAYLSEVYRLDRRILRNRRRSITDLTPERTGCQIVHYRSHDREALTSAFDEWRFDEVSKVGTSDRDALLAPKAEAFYRVLGCATQYADAADGEFDALAQEVAVFDHSKYFREVVRFMGRAGVFGDRAEALIAALRSLILAKAKCVVFCSDRKTADFLAERIREHLHIIVDRHDPRSDVWKAFDDSADHQVLVCDSRAEEGLNFQGGKKVVVHYDLPLNPNRVEQRLGRVDRYGTGDTIRSLVFVCDDDPIEIAWIDFLDSALKVFDRSVASLQYIIDQSVRGMVPLLFTDGVEAIQELTTRSTGDQGLIEREIRVIDQQDALDALGTPPTEFVDELSEVDADWKSIAADTSVWLDHMLRFGRVQEHSRIVANEPSPPFRYVYSASNPHTLIPLPAFIRNCADALDLASTRRGEKVVKTIPYTFRRRSALQRIARANGVGLLRYGDPLMKGINTFTEADDRGKSFAMWRYEPGYEADSVADIYVRFDFLLEADIVCAVDILDDFRKTSNAAVAAIRRRGEMALPPFYRSVWLNRELTSVSDPAVLALLRRPYRVESDQSGALDLNLNIGRWGKLAQLRLPELAHWSEFCFKARAVAEEVLRADPELVSSLAGAKLRTARIDQGRLSQLRARTRFNFTSGDAEELLFEEQLAAAIHKGISAPTVRVDTVGAIFVSASRHASQHLSSAG